MKKSSQIKEKARGLGFELVGITQALPPPDFDFFRWWLDKGYAANMAYLQRGAEKRGDPEKVLAGVKSVICVGLNYNTDRAGGPIACYAQGHDYHEVLGDRLKALENFIQEKISPTAQTKSYVDTGPVLERSYAAQAGLGWIGKNTCLINNGVGSFVFLGEILTTLELEESEYDRPGFDQCGSCTKCLDACPTQAFPEPYALDSNKCISYLTIEYRGEFSPEQKSMVGDHIYGCDICQQVCPYNDRIPVSPLQEFQPQIFLKNPDREKLKSLSEPEFKEMIQESAMSRIKYGQWVRNIK